MSGAYVSSGSAGGWTVWDNARTSKYEKYDTRIVVIVSKGKNPRIVLSPAVMKALGNPEVVKLLTRGSNAAIQACEKGDSGGYMISDDARPESERHTWHIDCTAFIRGNNLQMGTVYEAVLQNKLIVFDMSQVPSRL